MENTSVFIICLFTTLILTVLGLKILIPILLSKKVGQKILEIGPRWHKNKEGTPTMGGISFILASIISFVLFLIFTHNNIDDKMLICGINIMIYAILNAMIGFIDDMAKMRKAQNEGLTPIMKFSFQSIVAILFLISMRLSVGIEPILYIPFLKLSINIGFWYYIIAFFILCGLVNSVNLTDGIDGLASGVVLSVGLMISLASFTNSDNVLLSFFGAVLIGASIGFLTYNLHPAKVFMGDTGSLFLGAIVVGISFITNNILISLVYGFVFICEALSDILQVSYFKLTKGKRIFKMAPLHHHFEQKGWSEMKIVSVFSFVNLMFCIIAYFGMVVV